jgi:hypothetical protein
MGLSLRYRPVIKVKSDNCCQEGNTAVPLRELWRTERKIEFFLNFLGGPQALQRGQDPKTSEEQGLPVLHELPRAELRFIALPLTRPCAPSS